MKSQRWSVLLGLGLVSCAAAIPGLGDVNELVLRIREYDAWAWAAGIGAIWADLVLPVPQTVVIAALGIIPYNLPEAAVVAAGLGGMQPGRFLLAVSLGSVPTAFVFSAIGAGWQVQLALVLSYVLPIPLVPVVLYLVRRPAPSREHTR